LFIGHGISIYKSYQVVNKTILFNYLKTTYILLTTNVFRPYRMNSVKEKYGPWAVVTGASSGIGREIAIVLASFGVDVAIVSRREAKLKTLSAYIHEKWDVEVKIIVADLLQVWWY
jgi:NADPH:quinone reductase-like Zn-dependent oxidoreductase